jgi:DNA-binding MarR family transcriptional regulator
MSVTATERRIKVLHVINQQPEHQVEHATGFAMRQLCHMTDIAYDQLEPIVRQLAVDEYVEKDVTGKRCFAIRVTDRGREFLSKLPADVVADAVGAPPGPAPKPPTAPPPSADRNLNAGLKCDLRIAGGKRAPIIDVAFEDPPAPPPRPVKVKPLSPLDALIESGALDVVRRAEGDWTRVMVWPSKGAAARIAKIWRESGADELVGIEIKPGRIGEESSGIWLRLEA